VRTVEPYALTNGREGWYVASFDPERDDVRHFRLDRIKHAEPLDETYVPRPEVDPAAEIDGWLRTGDVGTIDADGFVTIVDRLKDMIVTGGENVSSLEVERVVYEHEAVLEAAVVASPHPKWNEVPAAYVVLAPGTAASEEELIGFCAERLAKYKVPKAVRFIDVLPRNPSGKVLKRELRDREFGDVSG